MGTKSSFRGTLALTATQEPTYAIIIRGAPDVEELLAERGVAVTYGTVRQWCRKFGQTYANVLRCRRARPGDKSHLDEVFLTIKRT